MIHPVLKALVRTEVRQAARRKGAGLLESLHLSKSVTNSTIEAALSESPEETRVALTAVEGLGDGTLIQKFLDFLASDAGKALIGIILKLLGL